MRAGQSAVSSSLVSVLKDELKYERENYRKDEALLQDGPPSGFELENTPGRKAFYLLKVSDAAKAGCCTQHGLHGGPSFYKRGPA